MFELSRIPYFVAVAQSGSFVKASEQMRIAKSAVTSQIQKLETELGVQLFRRTTRQVVLTIEGSEFLKHCWGILERCEIAQQELLGEQNDVSGVIRITATSDTGPLALAPILAEFSNAYPKVEIDLLISDDVLDMVANRIDLAIREGELKSSGLKAIRLRDFEQWVVCGAKYTAAVESRNSIESLNKLKWGIVTKVQTGHWVFTSPTAQRKKMRVKSVFQSNNTFAVLNWVESSPGCAVLPDYLVRPHILNGNIVRLLPQMKLPDYKVHAVYQASSYLPKRTRLLLDFIKSRLGR